MGKHMIIRRGDLHRGHVKRHVLVWFLIASIFFFAADSKAFESRAEKTYQRLAHQRSDILRFLFEAKRYRVSFDYGDRFRKERQIVRNVYYKLIEMLEESGSSVQLNIGIAKMDINNDSKEEILAFIKHSGTCGSRGCVFIILESKDTENWKEILDVYTHEAISFVESGNSGYMDIFFTGDCTKFSMDCQRYNLWRFDKNKYKLFMYLEAHFSSQFDRLD